MRPIEGDVILCYPEFSLRTEALITPPVESVGLEDSFCLLGLSGIVLGSS